ncbi:hypothetical protein G4228_011773 [Cervus hanglu yarkandensis]|nr:hypothetical protein G4228_011773 [Cervus hanglu yarkandensis]
MFHFFRKPPESKKPSVPETEADGFVLLALSKASFELSPMAQQVKNPPVVQETREMRV